MSKICVAVQEIQFGIIKRILKVTDKFESARQVFDIDTRETPGFSKWDLKVDKLSKSRILKVVEFKHARNSRPDSSLRDSKNRNEWTLIIFYKLSRLLNWWVLTINRNIDEVAV